MREKVNMDGSGTADQKQDVADLLENESTRTSKTRATGVPVQRHATLHEGAVQAIARGEVTVEPYKPGRQPRRRTQQPLDYHIQPCELLQKYIEETLSSTENSYTKVRVTSPESAILR